MKYAALNLMELAKEIQKYGICPFHYARSIIKLVDILFIPYNYLFNKTLRDSIGLELSNKIIIMDEAHNC